MRNFISEDDIERAILSKLHTAPFEYDIITCDADPNKRDDWNDGTGRSSNVNFNYGSHSLKNRISNNLKDLLVV